ncbi:histidine kinase, partial [Streptomyces sp. NPDC059411]
QGAPVAGRATPGPATGAALPRRVRQASLAPQLKNAPAPAPAEAAADTVEDRDAEDVRRRMSALQRGWTAGRDLHAQQNSQQHTQQDARRDARQDVRHQAPQPSGTEAGTPAATGPGYENEGDGR